jgi:hypothetical protein
VYSAVLLLHSNLRWAVLLFGILAVARAITASGGGRAWGSLDDAFGRWFVIMLDVQFVLGLLLYVGLSPFTQEAFADFGAAMRNAGLRFFAVEHVFGMVIGLALAHIGRVKIRKAREDVRRQRLASLYFSLAMLAILASIPWPGTPAGRPLFRP